MYPRERVYSAVRDGAILAVVFAWVRGIRGFIALTSPNYLPQQDRKTGRILDRLVLIGSRTGYSFMGLTTNIRDKVF